MAQRKATARKVRTPAKMVPRSALDSPLVRTAAIAVGIVGLAALAVALAGPRRVRDELLAPMSNATWVPLTAAVTPQAERAWAETRPWRDRLSNILASINTDEVRGLLADRLSHWFDRIRP